jgi:hypothetical protein
MGRGRNRARCVAPGDLTMYPSNNSRRGHGSRGPGPGLHGARALELAAARRVLGLEHLVPRYPCIAANHVFGINALLSRTIKKRFGLVRALFHNIQ